jgi:hypothetical protein
VLLKSLLRETAKDSAVDLRTPDVFPYIGYYEHSQDNTQHDLYFTVPYLHMNEHLRYDKQREKVVFSLKN